jgi:hypothetical protein
MASTDDYCQRAVETLSPLLRQEGFRYLKRVDEYTINSDYSLSLRRALTLQWRLKQPLHCFETGCWTKTGGPIASVDFRVSVRDAGRVAFALPRSQQWTPSHAKFVVGVMPALPKNGKMQIALEWSWPNWWETLRKTNEDTVAVTLPLATDRFEFVLKYHLSVGPLELLTNCPGVEENASADDNKGRRWTYVKPTNTEYVFTCRRAGT